MQENIQHSSNKKRKIERAQNWQQHQPKADRPLDENQGTQSYFQDTPDHYNEPETFLSWEAPGRPFLPRSKEFFINAFLIMMALEIILFLFSQYLLMGVILALVFFTFSIAGIPPRKFIYKISTEGIRIEKHFFLWEELYDFYVFKTHKQDVIYIGTKFFLPGEIMLVPTTEVSAEMIRNVLLYYLPFREHVEPTFMEKAGTWLENNFPLEKANR